MERQVSIYALCDPDTEEVRYIGQTVDLKARFYQHANNVFAKNPKKEAWVQSLQEQSKTPLLKVLCEVDSSVANQAEIDAIEEAKKAGANLLNIAPGGKGRPLSTKPKKRAISVTLDRDIVEWIDSTGVYRSEFIEQVLQKRMDAQRPPTIGHT